MAAKTNVTSTTTGCDLRSFESLFGRAEWVRPVTRWSVTLCATHARQLRQLGIEIISPA